MNLLVPGLLYRVTYYLALPRKIFKESLSRGSYVDYAKEVGPVLLLRPLEGAFSEEALCLEPLLAKAPDVADERNLEVAMSTTRDQPSKIRGEQNHNERVLLIISYCTCQNLAGNCKHFALTACLIENARHYSRHQ
jgi:hypothetical protein